MTDRRLFLKAMAAAGGGLMLQIAIPSARARDASTTSAAAFEPNAVVRITADGKVYMAMPYVEMGQGTYTSIPMLIAEELEVDLKDVILEHAGADDKRYMNPALGFQVTGGSTTMRVAWMPMAPGRRRRPHDAGAGRSAAVAGRSRQLPRRTWHGDPHAVRPQAGLRRTGRRRRQAAAAGCENHRAETAQGLPPDRQSHAPSRHAGKTEWLGRIRHRRPTVRHESGRAGDLAGIRRPPGRAGRGRRTQGARRAPGSKAGRRRSRHCRQLRRRTQRPVVAGPALG